MTRYLLLLLLSFLASPKLHAQEDPPMIIVPDGESEDPDPLIARFVLEGGITKCRPWQLNQQLFGHHQFDQLTAVGFSFGVADETCEESEDFIVGLDLTYGFHKFLMTQSRGHALNGDSMNYKLQGWEIMTSSIAFNLIRSEYVDFVIGIGMFAGNLKLYSDNLTQNTGDRLYKNPFFAPMLRTELRFNVWRFTFGARVSYRHDVTNSSWRVKDESLEPIPDYEFNEMQFMFYFGLRELNP